MTRGRELAHLTETFVGASGACQGKKEKTGWEWHHHHSEPVLKKQSYRNVLSLTVRNQRSLASVRAVAEGSDCTNQIEKHTPKLFDRPGAAW